MTERWKDLESRLRIMETNGLAETPPIGVLQMGRLYHETLSDLGRIHRLKEAGTLAGYLNRLLARVYLTIYRRPQVQLMELVWFFLQDFPALVWKRIHFVIVAALIFAFSGMIGFLCISHESKLVDLIIPKTMQAVIRTDIGTGQTGYPYGGEVRLAISSEIMFNNIKVSFMAFATGVFLGLGTVYLLIINGMLLGALASMYHTAGAAWPFWALILPHGGIELTCCFISAGAGLVIGYSIFNRTPYRRRAWMASEAMDAVKLVAGTIPWFVIAALIETYVTPAWLAPETKYILSGVFFGGFLLYFLPPVRAWIARRLIGTTGPAR